MVGILKSKFYRHTTILDRYLFREFMGPFLLAIGGFAIIAMVDILFYYVELAVISGVSVYTVVRLLVYKLPSVMVLFFPMAVLFSVMLMLVRMAKDNELTVLRASGMKLNRIVVPIFFMAFFAAYLSYLTNEKLVPWTSFASEQLIQREIDRRPPPDIVENVVFKGINDRFFYIKKVNDKEGRMEDVLVFEPQLHLPRIISAKEARWDHKTWVLMNGFVQEFGDDGAVTYLDRFTEMTLHMEDDVRYYFKQKTAYEMNSKELKTRITVLNKGGISTRALKVEYNMKKSLPAACFVFGIIGIAFSLWFVKSGKDWWGVIVAICITVLAVGFYFFLVAFCRALAKDGQLVPFLGAWLPNLIYGGLGFVAIYYKAFRM